MPSPSDYRFSDTHEWFSRQDDVVTMGITQYAADELTDITYVEMRPLGTVLQVGDPIGEVESVKTTSEVYSAVAGEIVEVNEALAQDPSVLNSDPFGDGWLVRIRSTDPSPLGSLLDQPTYDGKHPVG